MRVGVGVRNTLMYRSAHFMQFLKFFGYLTPYHPPPWHDISVQIFTVINVEQIRPTVFEQVQVRTQHFSMNTEFTKSTGKWIWAASSTKHPFIKSELLHKSHAKCSNLS